MSYDVSLPNGEEINMTSNIRPMLDKAYGLQDWKTIQFFPNSVVLQMTAIAICRMRLDSDEYKKLNPENGWGSYEGAMRFLSEIFEACDEVDGKGGISIFS
ncbi:hypothetical protein N8508_00240 [bacterium]|nr:hypothetical protein [bacterium]